MVSLRSVSVGGVDFIGVMGVVGELLATGEGVVATQLEIGVGALSMSFLYGFKLTSKLSPKLTEKLSSAHLTTSSILH